MLAANGYKDWALQIPNKKPTEKQKTNPTSQSRNPTPLLGLPYIQGLSEELQRVFKDHGISTFHKPVNTLPSLLVRPKDPTEVKDKCGVVYNVDCNSCDDSYVGETARKMGKRFEEHAKSDKESAVLDHITTTGHNISLEDVSILAQEPRFGARKIKEALEIYKRRPSLNKDQGLEIPPVLLQLLTPTEDTRPCRGPRVSTFPRADSQ